MRKEVDVSSSRPNESALSPEGRRKEPVLTSRRGSWLKGYSSQSILIEKKAAVSLLSS